MSLNKPLLFTNFFAGDVVAGYLLSAIYWKAGETGIVLEIGGITIVLLQTPAGAFIDSTRFKYGLIASCGIIITAVSVLIVMLTSRKPILYTSQILMGVAIAFVARSTVAITLGVCTEKTFALQTRRPIMLVIFALLQLQLYRHRCWRSYFFVIFAPETMRKSAKC
ncbi:hypothetical protein Misp06_00923 [Microbulbifer sp. NBRC 101763]|uniref:hypothetical protein n=1 Tax=Microbulbifer sp. NBRC 101763 TaxID=1113820 RepID=UPI0030A3EFF5